MCFTKRVLDWGPLVTEHYLCIDNVGYGSEAVSPIGKSQYEVGYINCNSLQPPYEPKQVNSQASSGA